MANDTRKRLYQALNDAGYNIGDYDEFDKRMNNADDRESFFNAVNSAGYNLGSREDFEKKISPSKYSLKIKGVDTPVSEREYKDFVARHPKPQQAADVKQQGTSLPQEDFQTTLDRGQRAVEGVKGFDDFNANMEKRYGIRVPKRITVGESAGLSEGRQRLNPETGELEQTYVTEAGNEYDSKAIAELEQRQLENERWRREHPKEALLGDIDSQVGKLDSMLGKLEIDYVDADGRIHYKRGRADDEAANAINTARQDLKDARTRIERSQQLEASSDFLGGTGLIPFTHDWYNNWKNFGYGIWDTLQDPSLYDFGRSDLTKAGQYLRIKQKIEKGEELTDQETAMALAGMSLAQAQQIAEVPHGYTAGVTTMEMAPFMLQMAANPASGFGRGFARQAVRKFGRDGIKAVSARVAARVLGNIGEAAVLSNTLQAGNTAANVLQRYTGDSFEYGEDGKLRIGHYEEEPNGQSRFVEGGKGALRSMWEGEASSIIENFTELGTGGNINKFLAKMVNSKAGRAMGLGYISDMVGKIGATPFARNMKKFMERTHWDGMIEEPLEEEYGIILNSLLTGDNKISDLWDSEQQADIFAGTMWFGGIMAGLNTAAYPLYRRKIKRELNRADIAGQQAFGEEWPVIKDGIDELNDKQIGDYLYSIKDNDAFSNDQKAALFAYVSRLKQQQGASVADMLIRMEGGLSKEETDVRNAYAAGEELTEPQDMNDAKNRLDMQREKLGEFATDLMMEEFDNNPIGALQGIIHNENWTEEEKQTAIDYVNARLTYDGMINSVRDDIDSKIAQSDATIDQRRNPEDMQVHPAMTKTNQQVYVIGGSIIMNNDGTAVDREATMATTGGDGMILAVDAETGKVASYSVDDFLSADEPIDANQLKQENAEAIRQTVAQQAADKIDGKLAFMPGDTYTVMDEQGNEHTVQVFEDQGDGTVAVYIDGNPQAQVMAIDTIQQMADNYNKVRIASETEQKGNNAPENIPEEGNNNVENIPEEQTTVLSQIPVMQDQRGKPMIDKQGNPAYQWHMAPVETTSDALTEMAGGNVLMARDTAKAMIDKSNGELEKARRLPVKGDDPITIMNSRKTNAQAVADAQARVQYWKDVNQELQRRMEQASNERRAAEEAAKTEEQKAREAEAKRQQQEQQAAIEQQRRREQIEKDRKERNRPYAALERAKKEVKGDDYAASLLENVEPRDLKEWVSSLLRPHSFIWENETVGEHETTGLQSELGLQKNDFERLGKLLATRAEGGKPFAEVVDEIREGLPEAMKEQFDDQAVRNTLLELFQEGDVNRMLHLTEEHRIEEAREAFAESQRREAEAEMEAWAEAYHLSPEERAAFEDYLATPPSLIEQDIVNQIILDNEDRRSQEMDRQPVSGGNAAGVEGSQGQVRQTAETAGNGVYEETVAEGAEAGGSEQAPTDNHVVGAAEREAIAVLLDQIGADPTLADNMSDYEVEQMTALVEDWEAVNDDLGYIIEQNKNKLKSKDKTVRDAAQQVIDEAQAKANEAFEQVQQYIEGLTAKYRNYEEEGVIPTPDIDEPRYNAIRQALIDAYKSGDPAAITQAAQAIQQYVDEGLDAGEDKTEMFDIAEDYDGNDPEKLADQYIIRTFWDRYLDDDVDQEYIKTGLKPSMSNKNKSVDKEEDPITATVKAARNGDKDAQAKLDKFGIKWEKKPVVRFVAQGEVESILNGNRYEGRFGNGRVDVTNNTEVTTAATADYRITFKDELDWTLNDRLRMKNEELGDGYIMDGYSLDDVATIEKRNPDGTYTKVYDAANPVAPSEQLKPTEPPSGQQPIGKTSTAEEIAAQEAQVDITPTEAQKEAGNYQKGHINVDGYDITIENPKGSIRRGTDADGKQWEQEMHNTYGYIKGTEGVDGDHIDVFLSDNPASGKVWVVDQVNKDGSFDEHKVMYGFANVADATKAYLSNYEDGWQGLGNITEVSREEFKKWVESSHRKTKPFAEYKSVKKEEPQQKPKAERKHKRIVSDDQMAELRKKLLDKMNQANSGLDMERMLIGAAYAVGKIERGVTKFADFCADMVADLGDAIRPYLKLFYNGARDLPEAAELRPLMDDAATVEAFDVYNFDKEQKPDVFTQAEQIDKENTVKQQAKKIKKEAKQKLEQGITQLDLFAGPAAEATGTEQKGTVAKPKLDKSDYRTYMTPEAKEYFAHDPRFVGNKRPDMNYITAAVWDGVVFPEEVIAKLPEIVENEKKVKEIESQNPFTLTDKQIEDYAKRLIDAEHGSAVFEDGEIKETNGHEDFSGPVKQERKAFIVIGRPAGGKSSVFANPLSNQYGARIVDSDVVKEWFDEFEDGYGAGYVQDMSSAVAERALDMAVQNGDNIVLPRIGGSSVIRLSVALRMMGYDVQLYYNDVVPETSYMRSNSRCAKTGRYLSLDYLTSIKDKPSKIFSNFAEKNLGDYLNECTQEEVQELRRRLESMAEGQQSDLLRALYGWLERRGREESDQRVSDHVERPESGVAATRIDGEAPIFTYSEWKSNDVAFGEKPKEIWNSESGKPLPGSKIKENNNGREDSQTAGREGTPGDAGVHSREHNDGTPAVGQRVDANLSQRGNERQGDRGVSQIPQGTLSTNEPASRPSGRVQQLETPQQPKNLRNNHAERGKDYAPKGVDARIEANIKAIETMQQLIENGKEATDKQKAVLRQFSGWGGLGKAFDDPGYSKRLHELLGEEAYQQAVMSRNSAYYTPAMVIDTMWDIAKAMGFKGGNVLEGSAGIGNIIGQMPKDMSERSNIQAVEIDSTTGNILKLLYPDAQVDIQGFEQTRVPNGSVDLAITNVPFVTGLRVMDTTGDKDLSKKFHDIHDFCIAKNIRKLKEGGIGIFISSSGTLDNSKALRDWITSEGNSDVVGAFRLNNETFGGTGATSDIIVVRKRVNGKKSPNAIDVSLTSGERTAEYDTGETKRVKGEYVPVTKQLAMDYNQYFIEHPENMAGKMMFAFEKGDTFRPTSKALYPVKGKDQAKMLEEWAKSFEGKDWEKVAVSKQQAEQQPEAYEQLGPDVKEGSMVLSNGKLCVAQFGKAVPLDLNANKVKGHTKQECFKSYQAIKQALSDVLSYQTEHDNNNGLQPLLDKLNKAYDSFVRTYGHLHKNNQLSFLKNDVDYPNVFALETYSETGDPKTGKRIQHFGKTDVFNKRVVEKEKEPKPQNINDAIIAGMYINGRIDTGWIADKLNESGVQPPHGDSWTQDDVRKGILASGLGFEDPTTNDITVYYEYLSGNVREKLQQALDNNQDGRYNANIKALEKVMPSTIPAHLIDFSIGSSWIDPKLYEDYVKEKTDVDVKFTPVGGTWHMKEPHWVGEEKNRAMGITSEMLRKTIYGTELIEAAMTNKTITVSETHKKWDGSTETIVDKEATQAVANKIDEIRQDFKDWAKEKMQSDPELAQRVEKKYNDTFNNYAPKNIDEEFVPVRFAGASVVFKLQPHQAKAAIRGTTQPLLLAHEVGSGKTFTLITTAMEMRRLGTARKPMIVVQNATLAQFVSDAKALYPNAKVLTLEDKDHTAEGRKNFYAKIKYNDWDMIVIPQSVFERIPDSEERQMAYVHDKIEEKLLVLEQMKDVDKSGSSMIVRQAEKEIEKLENELADLSGILADKRKKKDEKKAAVTRQNAEVKALEMLDRDVDDVENFDDMGIDALLVDEAHEYKHLGFATAMQRGVKGVDPSYSKKAQGVFLKTQAVLEKNNGRNVVFATGTPISNTAAEIWTFMRYLMPADVMKDYGIYYFDDFVRNFGNLTQMLEFTTSGKFKENNRFAGYINLPELVRIWSSVADTVLNEDIEKQREARGEKSKIPELESGKAQDIYLPQTKALRSVMKYVKSELERYENMSGKQKKENSHIPLTMYGIAKAAAVDARLVVDDAADEPQSKTNEAVRQTLKSLEETKDYKGTIALFADNYQNKRSGFNLYEDIRKKLIEAGVPAEQVAIIKSGMSIKKKQEIFDKVNSGEIRVIMGSTFTLGTGVNIQERLHTLIHLDAPNRPMDYTQRNGRILRQGNLHKQMGKPVRVLRFGVEDSLDVTAYQRLKTKGAIADSIMHSKDMMANSMENRALEEEEDVFGDTVAQLSGSEYAMLKNQAEKDVRKYEAKKKQWEADQAYVHTEIPRVEAALRERNRRIKELEGYLEKIDKAHEKAGKPLAESLPITIGKQSYADVEAMADFIKDYNKKLKESETELRENPSTKSSTRQLTVNIGGIDFIINTEQSVEVKDSQGTLFTAVRRVMTYDCPELGIKDEAVHQSLLRNALEDIEQNVMTGKDYRERLQNNKDYIEQYEKQLAQLKERDGKPFQFTEQLEKAHEHYDEYSELMKKELEEKEKKYAEMDKTVEAATDVEDAEEAEEEEETDNVNFRDADEDEELLNNQVENIPSQELLLSLSQKDDYERNEAINELVRRVREGEARIIRMGQEVGSERANDAQIAGTILGGLRQLGLSEMADETLGSMVPGTPQMEGRPVSEGKNTSPDSELALISWAKATGHYISESEISAQSLDKGVWQEASESRVYRTAGGKKVIKFTETHVYYDNPLLKRMDSIELFNAAGFEPLTVLGYSLDEYGKLYTVIEQNYVDGVTVDEIFDDEPLIKMNNYLDTFMEDKLGLVRHIDAEGNLFHMKDGIIYKDIHGGNVLMDKNSKLHVIDCYVSREGDDQKERGAGFSIKDVKNFQTTPQISFRDDEISAEESQPVFYSNAMRAVENIKQDKATPQQWLAMIEKAGGLKAGEDKWLGLTDWLQNNDKRTLTKQEVLDYIKANQIEVEEVNYGKLDSPAYGNWNRDGNGYRNGYDEKMYIEDVTNTAYYDGKKIGVFDNFDDAENALIKYVTGTNPIHSTRLDYTTRGLDNKREIALTVPTIEPWNEGDQIHFGDAGEGRAVAWVRFGETTIYDDDNAKLKEANAVMADNDKWYAQHPEFAKYGIDKDGTLKYESEERKARQRAAFDEAYSVPQNKKVLVIDEIQSKRHQEGRKLGYKDASLKGKADEALKELVAYRRSLYDKYPGLGDMAYLKDYATPDEVAKEHNLTLRHNELEGLEFKQRMALPSAPFENNWQELAMKRMLRYAAENGYDKIAWTTGEQQAERYNIGQVVKRIQSGIYPDGTRNTIINLNSGKYISLYHDENGNITRIGGDRGFVDDAKNLSDVVGKELAIKILSQTKRGKEGVVEYSGDNLRFGGDGMKGFYDNMLVRFMNKYGKKWGVSVEKVELPKLNGTARHMWSIDVTPEMKESVMQGQPMFRLREDEPPTKTGVGYKVFVVKDGKLYPPMVANPNGEDTPVGEWLDADAAPIAGQSKTGRPQVKAGGKGTQGGSGQLAYRPGWHLGTIPYALQFNRKNADGKKTLFPKNFVWAEVEYADDVDYQQEAHDAGVNENGKYQHSLAGLKRVPVDGSYRYRTNPDPNTDEWIITGAMKVNRILKPSEVDKMVKAAGREPQPRQDGALTDADVEQLNKQLYAERLQREGEQMQTTLPERELSVKERMDKEAYAQRQWRRAHEVAQETIEKLKMTDKVEVRETAEGLSGRYAQAKGWYDKESGKVVIVLANHKSPSDVKLTILHECVTHYGLRELFGKNFDQFLKNVYDNASFDIRMAIADIAARQRAKDRKYGRKQRTNEEYMMLGTEEYLARLAEDTDFENAINNGWFQKIKSWFLDMLGKAGLRDFEGELTDNELRYILWRSYQNLAEPGHYRNVFQQAEDIAMQVKLNVGNYNKERARLQKTGKIDTSNFAAEADIVNMPQGRRIEEGVPRDVKNRNDEIEIEKKVNQMTLKECQEAYKRIDDMMRDEQGRDLDEQFEANKQEYIAKNGLKGIGPFMANDLKQAMDKYGSGMVELRYSLADRIEELGGWVAGEDKAMYRDDEDADNDTNIENIDAGRPSLEDTIIKGLVKLSKQNADNVQLRIDAMKAIGGNLSKLRQAMAKQRSYDKETVYQVVRLARTILDYGGIDTLTRGEVKKLIGLIAGAAGKEDITVAAKKVVDMLINNQLRQLKNLLNKQLSIRGTKISNKGVEVQGQLDVEGARMAHALKDGMHLTIQSLNERISDCMDRMGDADEIISKNAAVEYQGYMLAKQFVEEIKQSEDDERNLKYELVRAKEDWQAGKMTRSQYEELRDSIEDTIMDVQLERIGKYYDLMKNIGSGLRDSVQRAKEWREQEIQRANEIRHNANSDMEGRAYDEHHKPTWAERAANWSFVRFFMKPLATFDQMLRLFGSKNVNGEGYLWNRFMNGYTKASDKEWRNLWQDYKELDAKVSEVFGKKMKWSDLFSMERKMEGAKVSFWDGGAIKEHTLTPGNLLYIYMVNKMSDGRMKLRRMGIEEEDVIAIKNLLDPRFIELADWLQNEYLPMKRKYFNAVHEKMFGASMAAISDYFPLVINKRDLVKEEEVGSEDYLGDDQIGATITGNIIKRTKNAKALDITNADAFDVILGHLQQMEHWAAYAEMNKDLGTLLSYKHFRNQVLNMKTLQYGSGQNLWVNFKRAAAVVSGAYRPKIDKDSVDTSLVNLAKGVTAAKISMRLYTAFKQLLSYPAYLSEANIWELIKSTNPYGAVEAFNWAMDNLPGFSKRWQSRIAGDTRLQPTDVDWGFWKNNIVKAASRIGLTPNAFIDAMTVAMGAKAIYETKRKQFLNDGYSEEKADEKAKNAASISFNETQQSSENAFLSAMQLDRTVASVALTVFRNASMGYQRRLAASLRNLSHMMTPGYKERSIEFMQKQMERDGLTEQQAQRAAKRAYNRSWYKNIADTILFGFVMQLAWNLGPYLPYLLAGDDDDEKDKMLEDAALHALAGGVEGLTGGAQISELYNLARSGGEVSGYQFNLLPLMSDIQTTLRHFKSDSVAGWNDIINILVQSGVGVNPQTLTDAFVAIMDASNGDLDTAKEIAILMMRIAQTPQSALDKLFIDELKVTGEEARSLSAEEMAKRYAHYKRMKNAPLTGWAYRDEEEAEVESKYVKKFTSKIKERLSVKDDVLEEALKTETDNFMKELLKKEVTKRTEAVLDEMNPVEMTIAFDREENPDKRKLMAKRISKEAGASRDPYGGKTDAAYGIKYQQVRTSEDVYQDARLLAIQEQARDAGNDDKAKSISKERARVRKMISEITLDSSDKEVQEAMNEMRGERRKLLEILRK